MLEILFNESAAASLLIASRRGNISGDLARQREDILCFSLALGMGPIDEKGVGPSRLSLLQKLTSIYPSQIAGAARDMWENGRRSLSVLLSRAGEGEPIRIWAGNMPDEACGLCWLADELGSLGWGNLDVTSVRLPAYWQRPDGIAVAFAHWGEISGSQWGVFSQMGEKLPANVLQALALHWRRLKRENAPLRAVVNGRLVSVEENFYDPFLLRELDAREESFSEAALIGSVLGHYSLGVGNSLLAWRIQKWIDEGKLEAITQAEPDAPVYHRLLKKVPGSFGEK